MRKKKHGHLSFPVREGFGLSALSVFDNVVFLFSLLEWNTVWATWEKGQRGTAHDHHGHIASFALGVKFSNLIEVHSTDFQNARRRRLRARP